jgi:hypothetical protein
MYIPKRTEQSVLGSVHWIVCIEQCVTVYNIQKALTIPPSCSI